MYFILPVIIILAVALIILRVLKGKRLFEPFTEDQKKILEKELGNFTFPEIEYECQYEDPDTRDNLPTELE